MFSFDNRADFVHRVIQMKIVIDDHIIKGFEALRESVQFEDEPSSFEAALQATKDRE